MCEKTQNTASSEQHKLLIAIKSQRYSEKTYLHLEMYRFLKEATFQGCRKISTKSHPEPLQDPVSILRRLGTWSQERLVWGGLVLMHWWLVAEVFWINKKGSTWWLPGIGIWENLMHSQQGFFDEWWSQRTRTVLTKRSTDNKEDRDKLLKFQLFRQWNDLTRRGM